MKGYVVRSPRYGARLVFSIGLAAALGCTSGGSGGGTDAVEGPAGGGPCPTVVRTDPPVLPDPVPTKFSLGLFHYNIQYVAGGGPHFEDLVITESLIPMIDFFEAHPRWGINLEMSGETLEVLGARFPDALARLRALAESGRIDVVSPLYQEQLWILFPGRSVERSWEIQEANLEALDFRIAPVNFFQEGAWGEGILPFLAERCLGTMVLPRNQYRFQYGEPPVEPWYERDGYPVVVGPGDIAPGHPSGIELRWNYLDDGEILPTGGWNPYFEPFFRRDDASIAAYADELQRLEDQGFWVTTISKYVAALEALGIAPTPLPLVTDGTWQPIDVNTHRWMGGAGLFGLLERDNTVRTLNYRSRNLLVAADTIVDAAAAAGADVAGERALLREGWRSQVLAEISDSTGINPIPVEAEYGIALSEAAIEAAEEAIDAAKSKLGIVGPAKIDTYEGSVDPAPEVAVVTKIPVEAPIPVDVAPGRRPLTIEWFLVDDAPETYELLLHFRFTTIQGPTIRVGFHRTSDVLAYSPAMAEDRVVEVSIGAFTYPRGANWLPLANGLVGIGDDWWVIKDGSTVHLAARYEQFSDLVEFENETAWEQASYTWRFVIVHGEAAEALEVANRLNTWPTIVR